MVALVRAPFCFINLLSTSFLKISLLLLRTLSEEDRGAAAGKATDCRYKDYEIIWPKPLALFYLLA